MSILHTLVDVDFQDLLFYDLALYNDREVSSSYLYGLSFRHSFYTCLCCSMTRPLRDIRNMAIGFVGSLDPFVGCGLDKDGYEAVFSSLILLHTLHSSTLATTTFCRVALSTPTVALLANDRALDRQLFRLSIVKIFECNAQLVTNVLSTAWSPGPSTTKWWSATAEKHGEDVARIAKSSSTTSFL